MKKVLLGLLFAGALNGSIDQLASGLDALSKDLEKEPLIEGAVRKKKEAKEQRKKEEQKKKVLEEKRKKLTEKEKKKLDDDLLEAAEKNKLGVVKRLLEEGADIDAKNNEDMTPLHLAVWEANLKMVKFLVGKGAKINTQGKRGWTPRQLAITKGHQAIADYLKDKTKLAM